MAVSYKKLFHLLIERDMSIRSCSKKLALVRTL